MIIFKESKMCKLLFLMFSYLCIVNGIDYRLPKTVHPINYKLYIKPIFNESYFIGTTIINVNVTEPVNSIFMHASRLNINKVLINNKNNENVKINFKLHDEYEFLELYSTGNIINSGFYTISINYKGSLINTGDNYGFYRAEYKINNTSYNNLWVTDFQATAARRAFPCFDEPEFKASFVLSIQIDNDHSSSHKVISNMNECPKKKQNSKMHYFCSTLNMSTYLVAFAITPYHFYESKINTQKIRIFTPNSLSNATKLLSYFEKLVEFYQGYFNMSSVIKKTDFIEYERETAGTENWGLITLKENLLSPDLDVYDYYQITSTISHELAHYYFGNFVTNKWWNDIWIQEGAAEYLAPKGVDYLQDFKAINYAEFPWISTLSIFLSEFTKKTDTLSRNVSSPESIRDHFNEITYIKGAAIYRMLEDFFTEAIFKQQLKQMLSTYAYSTITSNQFIEYFETFDLQIRPFLESYIYQEMFPVVTVEGNDNQFIIKQANVNSKKWTIPITFNTHQNASISSVWLKNEGTQLIIQNFQWIKLNPRYNGYYLVAYNSDSWWEHLFNTKGLLDINCFTFLLHESIYTYYLNHLDCKYFIRLARHMEPSMLNIPSWQNIMTAIGHIERKNPKAAKLIFWYIKKSSSNEEIPERYKQFYSTEIYNKLSTKSMKKCINWALNLENDVKINKLLH